MEQAEQNDNLLQFVGPVNDTSKNIIKVIGVGGGGCNAVGNMYTEGMENVTFAVCNTDSKSLSTNPVPVKLMLGDLGLGAGANPEVGRMEAEKSIEGIKHLLDDATKMVFIVAAMGGGTGTGSAPVVAKAAKDKGLLTIGIVTLPFYFEKKPKILKALRGLEDIRKNVDAMLIINNEQITKIFSDSHIPVYEALGKADKVMSDAVRSISELITLSGKIQTDFKDVETTMRNGGGAIMAIGRASGDNRVQEAVIDALSSPLLYGNDISKATRILLNIYTNSEHELYVDELEEIDAFMDSLDHNVEFIWGLATDNSLDEDVKVTILATGVDNSIPTTRQEISDIDEDEIIETLYGRKRKKRVVLNDLPEAPYPSEGPVIINLNALQEDTPEQPQEPAPDPTPDTTDPEPEVVPPAPEPAPKDPAISFRDRVLEKIKQKLLKTLEEE